MSEVFEGIICKSDKPIRKEQIVGLQMDIQPIAKNLQLVFRSDDRNSAVFSPVVENNAVKMSKICDLVLLFRYDSRIGYRYSALFEKGELKQEFNVQDEIYVSLDDDGEPLVNGIKFTFGDLEPEEEYETYKNAIELAFERSEFSIKWADVKEKLETL